MLSRAPRSAREDLTDSLAGMEYEDETKGEAARRFEAWKQGKTGYPIVDAGMRQLLAEGWMHNRVRMIAASFLVKDLHIWWRPGAQWFLEHLVDGDLASNHHGWQWVAGTGTDAAPYFRVFNPVLQGEKFDPDGEYVRRYVPELRDGDRGQGDSRALEGGRRGPPSGLSRADRRPLRRAQGGSRAAAGDPSRRRLIQAPRAAGSNLCRLATNLPQAFALDMTMTPRSGRSTHFARGAAAMSDGHA